MSNRLISLCASPERNPIYLTCYWPILASQNSRTPRPAPAMPTPSTTPVPFQVQTVNMSVTPASVSLYACGTYITVTYTATFTVSGSNGGTIQFTCTSDGGKTTSRQV